MIITIEESPQSVWKFDTAAIPNERLRRHILRSVREMLAPIRSHMYEHGEILSIDVK